MTKPTIGTLASGKSLEIDIQRLIDTRLLVQSNSGGGKSWLLRRLLEQTSGKVQQIILDTEGEFATLREKLDYVICAPHGADAVATPGTAALLARRLRETRVSAVIDLYDLKMHERRRFVRLFLEQLIDAPKAHWHPALVVVDETHLYCPEKGEAESAAAVIDLASRGRKRGLCAVLATQRLSKLHKDAAAELLNKLIGRTGLDVDVKRAADELGMQPREAMQLLRNLDPGEFYAFGPAISKIIEKVTVGPVVTKHPKSGDRQLAVPPAPSERIKKVLADLADLPKEAEQEAHTLAELKAANTRLKRDLAAAKKQAEQTGVPEVEVVQLEKAAVREALRTLRAAAGPDLSDIALQARAHGAALAKISEIAAKAIVGKSPKLLREPLKPAEKLGPPVFPVVAVDSGGLKAPEQRIINAIAWWTAAGVSTPSRHQVAFVAGYTVNGHFNNTAGNLRARGLIDYPGDGTMVLTDDGSLVSHGPDSAPTRDELIQRVAAVLKGEPMRRVFAALVESAKPMARADLAHACGYTENGHFNNIVGSLNGIGVIEYPVRGMVGLSDIFYGLS